MIPPSTPPVQMDMHSIALVPKHQAVSLRGQHLVHKAKNPARSRQEPNLEHTTTLKVCTQKTQHHPQPLQLGLYTTSTRDLYPTDTRLTIRIDSIVNRLS